MRRDYRGRRPSPLVSHEPGPYRRELKRQKARWFRRRWQQFKARGMPEEAPTRMPHYGYP